MRIKLDKTAFKDIESAFSILKKDVNSDNAVNIIKTSLEKSFDCTFDINIIKGVDILKSKELFVMSVYPEITVIDKIMEAILTNKNTDAIKTLWESNKKWTIEIDSRLFDSSIIDCTPQELTAILLHEVGHIICSSSIPNRVSLILRYEVMKTGYKSKMLMKNKLFRSIMSLPVLDSCVSDNTKSPSSIKEEIKADKFVLKMGYKNELYSILTKLMKNKHYPNNSSLNDKMVKTYDFSSNILDEFQARRDKIAKDSLISVKEATISPYICNVIDNFIESVFEDPEDSISLINGRKLELIHERADKIIEDECYLEFFSLGKKKLKKIDVYDLDYIDVKINAIKDENDKMMILGYLHNILDLVEYYIAIMEDPKLSKRYIIPHTLEQLYMMRKRLLNLRDYALKFRIPDRNRPIMIKYPDTYEG